MRRAGKRIIGLLVWCCLSFVAFAQPNVDMLRCELLTNPLGIDKTNPRLGWQIQADERNVVQTAYHVLVASSAEKLAHNIGDLWDSGKRISDNSIAVFYDGKALKSDTEVYWKVKVYTNKGESEDRKSTRLNSSHVKISYAVFCLKKKKKIIKIKNN